MELFNKLPGFVRSPPGLERVLLRRMPAIFAIGAVLLTAPSVLLRMLDWVWGMREQGAPPLAALVHIVDIYAMSALLLHFNLVLVTTIGAFIVMVMKGPAYVADAYPLIEADAPARTQE